MRVSICMPAYNEEDNIEKTVRDCFKSISDLNITGEVCVTDDSSKDKTPDILAKLKTEFPNLVVVTHDGKNEGYGRGIRQPCRGCHRAVQANAPVREYRTAHLNQS